MKLIIQIPCYNEENTLPMVLEEIPKEIEGIDIIEVMIINDGSVDNTLEVAQKYNVTHIINNIGNKGLGSTFGIGVDHALELGADILVNTDGDNQYPSRFIPELIQPIIKKEADIVVGDRQTSNIKHFSPIKKLFQWLGTRVTVFLSGESNMKDAVSGFRAYSRTAMMNLNITSGFSYVLDTTVQSSTKRLKLVSVPIEVNPPTRPSRLFKNIWQHIRKSAVNILRVYAFYKPLKVFFSLAIIFFILGTIPLVRFLYFFITDGGAGHIQSLVIGGVIISISINFFALGIIGDLMGKNRMLTENILRILKEMKYKKEE